MKVVVLDDNGKVVELPSLQDVPRWLKRGRIGKRMSMQDLGDRLGVTKQAVYSWESGLASPTPENLAKLVAIFSALTPINNEPVKKKSKLDAIDALLRPHAKNVSHG